MGEWSGVQWGEWGQESPVAIAVAKVSASNDEKSTQVCLAGFLAHSTH